MKKYPIYIQTEWVDCGATCLQMIAKFHGKTFSKRTLKELCETSREGISVLGLCKGASSVGLDTFPVQSDFFGLISNNYTPFIAHFNQNHFVVVYEISETSVRIADPAHGMIKLTVNDFLKRWVNSESRSDRGFVLYLEPTEKFLLKQDEAEDSYEELKGLITYLSPYKSWIFRLFLILGLSSLISLIFPFLTQAIVDKGIKYRNTNFIFILLIGQLMFFLGKTAIEFLRNWILLHIGSRISVSLIANFLRKLMQLPISFFDTKFTGDLLQRISDHSRIQEFLTSSAMSAVFSALNILVFGVIIAYYSITAFLLFCIGTCIYLMWVNFFLKKRKVLDYMLFQAHSKEQGNVVEMVNTMRDIKLYNLENSKMDEWTKVQTGILTSKIESLSLGQIQMGGASAINEVRNIIILFVTATEVLSGGITFGAMLAIQYIIGQLNGLVSDLVRVINMYQDAKLSYARLHEIHRAKDEATNENSLVTLPEKMDINFEKVNFRYPGSPVEVLRGISFSLPRGKITAIVGESGGGKSTILKLLLRFYEPSSGEIKIGNLPFSNLNHKEWRRNCGVVLQDSVIFTDTIARNISLSYDNLNQEKLNLSCERTNIKTFVSSLPLGFDTVIGPDGVNISEGQKQRLLLARVFYNDPEFVFLDEATNSLDSINENIIIENLNLFLRGKTVLIIAHRLSTIKSADQIIVMANGGIIESGSHIELLSRRGAYYDLVKKQLDHE